jgi:hypothetical protein
MYKGGIPNCKDCGKRLGGHYAKRCTKCAGINKRIGIEVAPGRNNNEYKIWRQKVWKRDNFKCKIDNQDCSGRIIAHHVLGWAKYPELRYEVNNGITLCLAHHPRRRAEEKQLIPIFQELIISKV